MSKVGMSFWSVLVALVASFVTYTSITPVLNSNTVIVFVAVIIGWVWLPVILVQWYMWSKD